MRYGAVGTRDRGERAIIDALEAAGCRVWQLHTPADLLVWKRGRWRLLEVKDEDAKPRKDQAEQEREQAELGIPTVRTPGDALAAIGASSE